MNIYTVIDILTALFESFLFNMLFQSLFKEREKVSKYIYIIAVVLLAVAIVFSNRLFNFGILNVVCMMIAVFLVSILYESSFKSKAVIILFGFVIVGISEIVTMFLLAFLYSVDVAEIVTIPSLRVVGIIVSKMITYIIFKIICLVNRKKYINLGISYWIWFFLILSTSMLAIFLIFTFAYNGTTIFMYNLSVICSFGFLFSTFFTLYLYEHMIKQTEIINKQQVYKQQVSSQAKHFDEILITQKELKKFRHDLKNHLIVLNAFFENNETEKGTQYIQNIINELKNQKVIKETGNTALDAILSTKAAIAASKNISFTTNIQIPENLPVDAVDICVIFGNALDNAIEACDRVSDTKKKISLTLVYQNAAMFCKIVNTAPQKKKNKLMTAKTDKKNHGFGLENIRTTLAKYNSEPVIEYNDTEFVLKFVIFINKQMNNKGPIS